MKTTFIYLFALLIFVLTNRAWAVPVAVLRPANAQAFRGWQSVKGYADSSVDVNQLPALEINCPSDPDGLYPTHPQQQTKIYHRYYAGGYDNTRLKGDDEACAMSSKYKSSNGTYACLRPDVAYYVLMSDIYRDRCGQLYRAYWHFTFLQKNENMATLFSLGRTMYPNPNSKFSGDFIMGGTYRVSRSQMLFLSHPLTGEGLNGDQAKATELRARALKTTHVFNQTSLLFEAR